jgi:DNA-binding SARP family transcriptional activator
MRFLILGPLVVLGDGEEVSLGGIKPRAVLAVLLLHANEAVSAERLARSLWGEDAPEGATRTVQVHVSRLRKALGNADIIDTTPAVYRLRVGADELDAAQFERLVAEGRHALDGGQPERAATILRDALELWRGPALADLAFEPFAAAHVSRLEEQRVAALEVRLEADLASGGHTELVDELQRLVVAHPTRERFVAQLMLALYRCGRQADALDAYQDARRGLLAAIGIEPGPQLRDLQQAILRQDVALEADGGVPELPPELDTATAPPLVGRDDEIAWLRLRWERAREGSGALVVIAGERGAGKTRLAAELAGDAHRRGDAVLHVTGRGSSKPAIDVLRGLPNVARRTLLVVDDADAGGAPDVLEALAACTRALASAKLLVVVCCEDPFALARLRVDGVLALEPLDAEGVRSIGRHYASAKAPAEVPAEWLLEASGGATPRPRGGEPVGQAGGGATRHRGRRARRDRPRPPAHEPGRARGQRPRASGGRRALRAPPRRGAGRLPVQGARLLRRR